MSRVDFYEKRKANDFLIENYFIQDPRFVIQNDGVILTFINQQGKFTNTLREAGSVKKDGFRHINFTFNGRSYKFLAHRIVYAAKVGKLNHELNITHADGNKLNNDPSNLVEATESESMLQRFGAYGNEAVRGNQKDDLKAKALQLRKAGNSVKVIEKALGVARSTVSVWVRDVKLNKEQKKALLLKSKSTQFGNRPQQDNK